MRELQNEIGDEEDPDGALDINALKNQLLAARKKRSMSTFLYGLDNSDGTAGWTESTISPSQKGFYASIYRFGLDLLSTDPVRPNDIAAALIQMDKLCQRKLPYLKLYGIKRAEIPRVSKKYSGLKPMSEFYNDWIDVILDQFYNEAIFPGEILALASSTDFNLDALRAKVLASHEEILQSKPFRVSDDGAFGRMDCFLSHFYTQWGRELFGISSGRVASIEKIFGKPRLRPDQVNKFIKIFNQVDYFQNEVKNSLLHLQPFSCLKSYRVPSEEIVKIINNFVPDKWN